MHDHVSAHMSFDESSIHASILPWALSLEVAGKPDSSYVPRLASDSGGGAGPPPHRGERQANAGASGEGDGGWSRGDKGLGDQLLFAGYDGCGIDRWHYAELGQQRFMDEYVEQGKPVILLGLLDDWPAWTAWRREVILARHGQRRVKLMRSDDIVRSRVHQGQFEGEMWWAPLEQYIDGNPCHAEHARCGNATHAAGAGEVDPLNPPYLFEKRVLPDQDLHFHHPPIFEHERFSWPRSVRNDNALFFVGGAGTGAYCHQHSAAYNALIYGRKRWFVYPPNAFFGPHGAVMLEWLNTTYPHLPTRPVECIQESGETLFVPQGFPHCVLNLQESVGIAIEIGHDPKISRR
jgi:mannose-6-phosphate isomerase-like protein (cupin superfamily)